MAAVNRSRSNELSMPKEKGQQRQRSAIQPASSHEARTQRARHGPSQSEWRQAHGHLTDLARPRSHETPRICQHFLSWGSLLRRSPPSQVGSRCLRLASKLQTSMRALPAMWADSRHLR